LTEISSDFANLYKKCPDSSICPDSYIFLGSPLAWGGITVLLWSEGNMMGSWRGGDEQGEVNERER
jgi:hypothetical protein